MLEILKNWWQAVVDHPVLRLELRRVQRQPWWPGKRVFPIIVAGAGCAPGCLVLLMVLVILAGLVLAIAVDTSQTEEALNALLVGITGVVSLSCLLGVLRTLVELVVLWIAPAVTAMSIVREREMGTFDLLRTTPLSESSIVIGKLVGSLAWLWPGLIALALLTPVQFITVTGNSVMNPLVLIAMTDTIDPMARNEIQILVWILVLGALGTLRPWVDLLFHAVTGLLVSTLTRSAGTAIALAYTAVFVARGLLWLFFSVIGGLLAALVEITGRVDPVNGIMLITQMGGLARILIELGVTALLLWTAVWSLKRE